MALGPIATIPTASWVTPAQYPFTLYVNAADLIANVQATSLWLDDPGGAPARFGFTVEDPTGTIITNPGLPTQNPPMQSPVIWYSAVADRVLFHGYLKSLKPVPHATWASYALECADRSEVLDFSPIIFEYRPAESDETRIQALLRNVPMLQATAGVAVLNASLGATVYQTTTARQALADILGASTGGDYYLDAYGRLTTYSGTGGGAGPYNINNDAPNNSTTIAAQVLPETDGWSDVDGVYVIGSTLAGTGYVWGSARRDPPRVVQIQSETSVDAATLAAAGAAELARRQNIQRVQVTVDGWDGWARGQVITITDSRLDWTAQPFVVQGVSMRVLTKSAAPGTGHAFRRYTLTCGAYRRTMTGRIRATVSSVRDPAPGTTASGLASPQSVATTTIQKQLVLIDPSAGATMQLYWNGLGNLSWQQTVPTSLSIVAGGPTLNQQAAIFWDPSGDLTLFAGNKGDVGIVLGSALVYNQGSQTISAAGNTIDPTNGNTQSAPSHYSLINNTGANITLTSTPTITSTPGSGTVITIAGSWGNTAASTVTLQDNGTLAGSNLRLGAATRVLGPRDSITLIFDKSGSGNWIELGFSNVL